MGAGLCILPAGLVFSDGQNDAVPVWRELGTRGSEDKREGLGEVGRKEWKQDAPLQLRTTAEGPPDS